MSRSITINGVTYSQPDQGTPPPWGDTQADIIVALAQTTLQKSGGLFTLTAEADFGASFGLKSLYLKSRTANPASAGTIRLAVSDLMGWRNNANNGDLLLSIDGSDRLLFNGSQLNTGGNVSGPGSSTDDAIARFDLTTGKLLQNSLGILDDSGNLSGLVNISGASATLSGLTVSSAVVTDGSKNLASASASTTEVNNLVGTTQAIQTQIDRLKLSPGTAYNLDFGVAAGVFTIKQSGGTSLSSTAYGLVAVPSTTAGQNVVLKATTNASFQDATGSSSLTNLEWGISATANWANDMPFFLYVVNKGNNDLDGTDGHSAFFIARNPSMASTPSSSNDIGNTSSISVNDSQTVILLLGSFTVANYTSLPCQLIGAFRMRYATATHDWTIQTLGNSDGIGPNQLSKTFSTVWTMPQGQNGASSGTYLKANGGTSPVFSTNNYNYMINNLGECKILIYLAGDGSTAGAGAVDTIVSIPYSSGYAIDLFSDIFIGISNNSGTSKFYMGLMPASSSGIKLFDSGATNLQNSAFITGGRAIEGVMRYKAF